MNITIPHKTALVFGATGLVGEQLVLQLLVSSDYDQVKVFVRKEILLDNEKLEQIVISDFSKLEEYSDLIKGHDLFLCLGTTIKKAGSKENFKAIDFDLNFKIAKYASLNKVNQLLLISSAGADANAMVFYSKIKGQLEDAVKALPFWAVHIFRPAMLLGKRDESRPMEAIGQKLFGAIDNVLGINLGIYRPIKSGVLAKAMLLVARRVEKGVFYYDSDTAVQLAKK